MNEYKFNVKFEKGRISSNLKERRWKNGCN